jgi:hypothetical protein
VRAGAPWCTQCYAPAGTASPTTACEQRQAAAQVGVQIADRTPAVRSAGPSTGTWPCSACSQPNDLADAACAGCGTAFLAAVREERPTVVLPGVGDLLALSPVRRVGLAVCVVVVFVLITALLALLLA